MTLTEAARVEVGQRLRSAIFRESLALVDEGIATPLGVDTLIRTSIGRRWAVGGPFEIWEQIGWDLVQVIAGELFKEISNSSEPLEILRSKIEAGERGYASSTGFYKWTQLQIDEFASRAGLSGFGAFIEADPGSRKHIKIVPGRFQNIAVIGAGLMGHGIALEFAAHERNVVLHDISENLLDVALANARTGLMALASWDLISHDDVEPALARITTTTDLAQAVSDADLVIEAASESLDLKRKIFAEIDRSAPVHSVLASNSSTFVPSAYGSVISRPERVIGVHYFNPPHLLPGVEVVMGPETSDATADLVVAEYEALGKKPAVVRQEIQGFMGNRLQVALLREALAVVQEEIATADQVDEVFRNGSGRSLSTAGLFELTDRFGLASALTRAEEYFPKLSNQRKLPPLLLDKISSGDLGVKTGKGFYDWTPQSVEAWRSNMANLLLEMTTRDQ
jgi:3-hydroxybutyryl-CoA dehydrogenase